MLLGLEVKTWLGFAVVGALVSTVGALLGVALKEYFFVRSFDRWKQKQTLEQVYQRYRDPLFLSGRELASRLIEIDENFPTVYLKADILASSPIHLISNSINDPYYQRYKLLSSIFRLSAFLGWLELYRQDVTWLKSGSNRHSKKLEHVVELIRGDLADGQLNTAPDRVDWRDMLIFREELRAVGESMLEGSVGAKVVVGYCRFCEALEVNSNNHIRRWFPVVANFFLDLEAERKDFRRIRIKLLAMHLVDLMELLNASAIDHRFVEKRGALAADIHHVLGAPLK